MIIFWSRIYDRLICQANWQTKISALTLDVILNLVLIYSAYLAAFCWISVFQSPWLKHISRSLHMLKWRATKIDLLSKSPWAQFMIWCKKKKVKESFGFTQRVYAVHWLRLCGKLPQNNLTILKANGWDEDSSKVSFFWGFPYWFADGYLVPFSCDLSFLSEYSLCLCFWEHMPYWI